MSLEERKKVAEKWVEVAKSVNIHVIIHVGGANLNNVIQLVRKMIINKGLCGYMKLGCNMNFLTLGQTRGIVEGIVYSLPTRLIFQAEHRQRGCRLFENN